MGKSNGSKVVRIGTECQVSIVKGVSAVAEAVRTTYGPAGYGALMSNGEISRDGISVAKDVLPLEDPYENQAAQFVVQSSAKTNEEAGDGTTTATVLTHALITEGFKAKTAGWKSRELAKGINLAVKEVVQYLEKKATPCNNKKAVSQVGTISANNDQGIGDIIANAMEAVGEEGVITVEAGSRADNELDTVDGMEFDRGYLSPYFVNDQQGMKCELENPLLLLVDKKVSNIREMLGLLEGVAKTGRPLMIIAEDVEGEALATLVVNNMRGIVKVCAVKAPGFGDRRKAMLQDIAILTNGRVVSEEIGVNLEEITVEDLGSAKRIMVTKDSTTIVDGNGSLEAIKTRCEQIKAEKEQASSDYDKEKAQERLAKLAGGVAVIKVGAATEAELNEKKARVEDALNATRAAVESGVLPGGGVALVRSITCLDKLKGENEDQDMGISIVRKVLAAPLRQIISNGHEDPSVIVNKIMEGSGNMGYNVMSGEYGDMMEMGILDPTKVTRSALVNAASIACLLVTTNCTITNIEDENGGDAGAGAMGGGMPGMGMGGMGM